MNGKSSFVLYTDLIHTIEQLPDDKAGKLFKYILEYVNDKNPESDDLIVNIAFEPIKQQLKRDLQGWLGIREKRSDAGKKSAEKRAKLKQIQQKATKVTSVDSVKQNSTNPTVSVSGSGSVSVTEKDVVVEEQNDNENLLNSTVRKTIIKTIQQQPHFTVVENIVKELITDKRFTEKTSLKLLEETYRDFYSWDKTKQNHKYALGCFKGKKQDMYVAVKKKKSSQTKLHRLPDEEVKGDANILKTFEGLSNKIDTKQSKPKTKLNEKLSADEIVRRARV